MSRLYSLIFVFFLGLSPAYTQANICLTQIIAHPSLDLIRQGVLDELTSQKIDFKPTYYDAQGQMSLALQIAQTCVGQTPDVIVTLATPSAQAVLKVRKQRSIPVVFGGVTDPVGAGLIKTLDTPQENVTGTIDVPDTLDQLRYFKTLQDDLTALGVLFNPGEQNSILQIEALEKAAQTLDITLIKQPISKLSDITSSLRVLKGKVDALYVPNDNLLVSGIQTLIKTAHSLNLPVYVSDSESAAQGADGAYANDQYQVGRETGKLVARLLKGETMIPVVNVQKPLTGTNIPIAK